MRLVLLSLSLVLACGQPEDVDTAADASVGDTASAPCLDDFDGDGFTPLAGDCDDTDPARFPGAVEICNDIDDDCDGVTDGPDAIDAGTWYTDIDADGFGDETDAMTACSQPTGTSDVAGDCDDLNNSIFPGAPETSDGVDNDCDGEVDEASD